MLNNKKRIDRIFFVWLTKFDCMSVSILFGLFIYLFILKNFVIKDIKDVFSFTFHFKKFILQIVI